MLIDRRLVLKALVAMTIVAAGALTLWGPSFYANFRIQSAVEGCRTEKDDEAVVACIFRIISSELRSHGLPTAMTAFSRAYETYPYFANGGCHTRSHRVGDLLYYQVYLGNESLESIDFPQSATACGYGFFHGFIEHLIQDHPEPDYITKTCDYLIETLSHRMRDIGQICYHGAGHGLMLAQTERITKKDWGNVAAFVTRPASECDSLPRATPADIEQCHEGIFNILTELMTSKQYGFVFDKQAPFAVCLAQPKALLKTCAYEQAMKLDSLSGFKPARIVELVSVLPGEHLRIMAFGPGITGIIQQSVANGNGYDKALTGCKEIPEPYLSACVRSIVGGLFEDGNPQKEYTKAIAFCAEDFIVSRQLEDPCYDRLIQQLPRFYPKNMISSICPSIPRDYRTRCTDLL